MQGNNDLFTVLLARATSGSGGGGGGGGEGTVKQVTAGIGLTTSNGSPITLTGTIKAKLSSETALTGQKIYDVGVNSNGQLAVQVTWTDTHGEVTSVNEKTGAVTLSAADVGALADNVTYAGASTAGGSANSAKKLDDSADAGNSKTPVYFSDGVPTAIEYTIGASVPVDAVFTDTTYTLASGSGDDANKLIFTPSSGDVSKITVPYATSADSADAVAWSGVSHTPTTISGYGITDAKINNGVITLGSNTITPLTSHQAVTDNNPTLDWSTKSKVATIGSNEIHVTMPAKPTYSASDVGLGNVTNNAQVKKINSSTSGDIVTWSGSSGDTVADSGKSFETSLTSSSDTKIPTSKAVASYVSTASIGISQITGITSNSSASSIAPANTGSAVSGEILYYTYDENTETLTLKKLVDTPVSNIVTKNS